jgi:hypothetical protein
MSVPFDKLVRASMTIRDIRTRYPETAEVFEELGFRSSCDDCSIDVVARRQGLNAYEIVDRLNRIVTSEFNKDVVDSRDDPGLVRSHGGVPRRTDA